jgi:putative ABC transport system permease protein
MREVVLESTLVALVGGTAGLLAVLGLAFGVRAASTLPLALSPATAFWSFGSSALAGVLAGLYPARRASRVDVVAAVRAE